MARFLRGFTLLETILSCFVLALIMMSLFNLFPMSAMAVKRTEYRLQADAVAQKWLETYRSRAFESLTVGSLTLPPEPHDGLSFTPTVDVYVPPQSDGSLLKGVRVRVSYTYRGRTYQETHETWIAHVRE